jgi:hypothetical protein
MADHLPIRDPIGAERRKAVAKRRLGAQQRCTRCGEDRPATLIRNSDSRICARCQRLQEGHSAMDKHHPAGGANHPLTVDIPVNDHRAILTAAQHDWPFTTLENPDGDPLLRAAACIKGFVDTVIYQAKELLLWTANLLERLSAWLVQQFGRRWWTKTEFAAFAPKRKPKPDPKRTR